MNQLTQTTATTYPCLDCIHAQHMDFKASETRVRTDTFCKSIGKLLDNGLPVACSAYSPLQEAE